MGYKEVVFSFESGGNPDPYELTMSYGLTCAVDSTRQQITTIVEEKEVKRVQKLLTEAGYELIAHRNTRSW